MQHTKTRSFGNLAALAAAALLAVPAQADIKAGVDAWARGDYPAAVSEWRGPAEAGDPDAQFNMAQAYRLGRGVAVDPAAARALYEKAAAQGHLKAADNYGLLLFQQGQREAAMPYVRAASERGDPRAQYLLGIAHFNGDLAVRDWVRAYALMTRANAAGLPQAPDALRQMDGFIPMDQRQQAQQLSAEIATASDAARSQQLAAADLDPGAVAPAASPSPPAQAGNGVAAALAAVQEAERATGTRGASASPASAGADFARPAASTPTAATPRQTAAATAGEWRVQLGAFGVAGNAERLWDKLSKRRELAGATRLTLPSGRVTRLLAAGFATRGDADAACRSLKASGQDCLVTRD